MPKSKKKISAEQFVEAWQKSANAEQAAKKLGIPVANAMTKASIYRRKGIKLQKFPYSRGPAPLDIAALNTLAAKFATKKHASA